MKILKVILFILFILFAFYLGRSSNEDCLIVEFKKYSMEQQECFIEGKLSAQKEFREEISRLDNEIRNKLKEW